MKRVLIASLVGIILVAGGALRSAEPASTAASETQMPKARQMPFRGKISAVNLETRTISLAGKENSRTFHLTSTSRINKDGRPATPEEVKAGDSVGGLAREGASGRWEVVTLNVKGAAGAGENAP